MRHPYAFMFCQDGPYDLQIHSALMMQHFWWRVAVIVKQFSNLKQCSCRDGAGAYCVWFSMIPGCLLESTMHGACGEDVFHSQWLTWVRGMLSTPKNSCRSADSADPK